jgi:hypothetical protein
MTPAEDSIFRSYLDWQQKEAKRVSHEWDKEWDGTEAHGIVINDRQCERIEQAQKRLCVTPDIVRKGYRIQLAG